MLLPTMAGKPICSHWALLPNLVLIHTKMLHSTTSTLLFAWFLIQNLDRITSTVGLLAVDVHDDCFKIPKVGLPGSPVIKNLLCNAGNTGSIPDPGRSHALAHLSHNYWACSLESSIQLLRACMLQLLKPSALDRAGAPQWKPPQWKLMNRNKE